MTKKLLLPLLFSVILCHAYGLRNFEVGQTIPQTEATSVFNTEKQKVILVASSHSEKCADFLKAWLKCKDNETEFYLVDTQGELDSVCKELFNDIKAPKTYLPDKTKQIYSDLGVIVMPTMLFVNAENTLHSFIAGRKPNLEIFMVKQLDSLKKNTSSGDIFEELNAKKASNILNQKLNQAFKMMISENYDMAENIYKKATESHENLEAELGYCYSRLLNHKSIDSLDGLKSIVSNKDNPRVKFFISLTAALDNPTDSSLEKVAGNCRFESKFFNVLFFTGKLLEKNEKIEYASDTYKHAYKVLWNTYRRGR